MNPIQDLTRMLTTPLKALFVVGLCAVVNSMTYAGTWWVKWVALGMGIATLLSLARGLRTLLVLAALWWVGRALYARYGAAARERFDAWVASRDPQWSGTRQAMAEVMGLLRPGGPVVTAADAGVRH
ncbi:MAG: hypothetical protein U1F56_08530 [Rubrivivax sp.]